MENVFEVNGKLAKILIGSKQATFQIYNANITNLLWVVLSDKTGHIIVYSFGKNI